MLHAHQRRLAHRAGLRAPVGDDHDGQPGFPQRRPRRPAGVLVFLYLVPYPPRRARHVLTVNGHVPIQHFGRSCSSVARPEQPAWSAGTHLGPARPRAAVSGLTGRRRCYLIRPDRTSPGLVRRGDRVVARVGCVRPAVGRARLRRSGLSRVRRRWRGDGATPVGLAERRAWPGRLGGVAAARSDLGLAPLVVVLTALALGLSAALAVFLALALAADAPWVPRPWPRWPSAAPSCARRVRSLRRGRGLGRVAAFAAVALRRGRPLAAVRARGCLARAPSRRWPWSRWPCRGRLGRGRLAQWPWPRRPWPRSPCQWLPWQWLPWPRSPWSRRPFPRWPWSRRPWVSRPWSRRWRAWRPAPRSWLACAGGLRRRAGRRASARWSWPRRQLAVAGLAGVAASAFAALLSEVTAVSRALVAVVIAVSALLSVFAEPAADAAAVFSLVAAVVTLVTATLTVRGVTDAVRAVVVPRAAVVACCGRAACRGRAACCGRAACRGRRAACRGRAARCGRTARRRRPAWSSRFPACLQRPRSWCPLRSWCPKAWQDAWSSRRRRHWRGLCSRSVPERPWLPRSSWVALIFPRSGPVNGGCHSTERNFLHLPGR